MKDVHVLGLSPALYPAASPEYSVPDVSMPHTVMQALRIVSILAHPALDTATSAAHQFRWSVETGRVGVMAGIDGYERSTGCRPQYILTGFSQGAMVIAEHERELSRRGQLAGVVYLGNPMTHHSDRSTIGVANGGAGGMLGFLPHNSVSVAATPNRINYCLPLDAVCDLSVQTLQASEATGGNHGRYFLLPSHWDNHVYDSLGRWVDSVRY